jgi:hypothetical protein
VHRAPLGVSLIRRCAVSLHGFLAARDARVLACAAAVLNVLAWTAPPEALFCLLVFACACAITAFCVMPWGRAILAAYGFFILTWVVARFCLYLFEHPGAFVPALEGAALLGCRLFALLGLTLAVPLTMTPLTLGRVLSWFLGWLTRPEAALCSLPPLRSRLRPALGEGAWRASLALALMMAFFPRAVRTLADLRRNLRVRAPNLSRRRSIGLLALAALRILSVQTLDMALAIASRDLYRPQPWQWHARAPFHAAHQAACDDASKRS